MSLPKSFPYPSLSTTIKVIIGTTTTLRNHKRLTTGAATCSAETLSLVGQGWSASSFSNCSSYITGLAWCTAKGRLSTEPDQCSSSFSFCRVSGWFGVV